MSGKKVALVGFAESYKLAPFDDPSVEIWSINEMHRYTTRWDRWFELHARHVFELQGNRDQAAHVAWMKKEPAGARPIYTREKFDDIPASVPFPRAEITRKFFGQYGDREYFTSSIGFMLALAIAEGRDDRFQPTGDSHYEWIGLYGIDLAADSEYGDQRPNAEYFIGIARGLGIEVVIAPGSALLKADHVYGFEERADKEGPVSSVFLTTRKNELLAKRKEAEEHHLKALDMMHCLDGAIEEVDYHLAVIRHVRRGVQVLPK